jgi:hypothetical protein
MKKAKVKNGIGRAFARSRLWGSYWLLLAIFFLSCGIFEPRDPEPPEQSSFNFTPATVPSIVLSNLKNAVSQKNVENYIRNFSDSAVTGRAFVFVPSADASGIYPNVREWTYADERGYFQNLVAKADGFSTLSLTAKDSLIGASQATYNLDYLLTFQHTDAATFPTTASGTLQFVLAPDAGNIWSIYHWSDFSNSSEITWSSFKGKFGN